MHSKANKIFSVTLLSLVYIAFFAVQFFFNFDFPAGSGFASVNPFASSSVLQYQPGITKAAGHSSKKISFRLNKRFQPQSLPACDVVITEAPERYICSVAPLCYHKVFITACILINRTLRGPPVVV